MKEKESSIGSYGKKRMMIKNTIKGNVLLENFSPV